MDIGQNTEEKISSLHQTAKDLLLRKVEDDQIIIALQKEGIEAGYAELIIENVKTDLSDKENFRKELWKGIAVTFGGLLLNYLSYTTSIVTGSTIAFIFWGIIVFGISIIARAFILFKR
jgi:hypothetical protein